MPQGIRGMLASQQGIEVLGRLPPFFFPFHWEGHFEEGTIHDPRLSLLLLEGGGRSALL